MKFKFIALSLCMVASANIVKGQNNDKKFSPSDNRHEFRVAASDGLTLTTVDVLGMGLSDALTGTKRSNEKGTMVYSVGYRYALNRFRLGGDLGFAKTQQPADAERRDVDVHQGKGTELPRTAYRRIRLLQAQSGRALRNRQQQV